VAQVFLHNAVPGLIVNGSRSWASKVAGYFLQRMKTKWGAAAITEAGHIRLNTELVKKPKDLLEYVVVHEMLHLVALIIARGFLR
jgi:predicted metal-dependent hydrolase